MTDGSHALIMTIALILANSSCAHPAGVAFVIALVLIAAIWSYLKTVAAHSSQAADALAGEACELFVLLLLCCP